MKCKPSAQLFAYIYTNNALSKCSNIISHRSSVFEGRHSDHRSSKVGISIIDHRRSTQIIDLRKSTHRSSKVDTDPRFSKVDTSTLDLQHIDLRRSKAETSHRQSKTIRHRILSTTALHNWRALRKRTSLVC